MDQLQVPHHSRQHMTDSEVLLLAYEKWSERMPERLVGDFAFIIWDESGSFSELETFPAQGRSITIIMSADLLLYGHQSIIFITFRT